MKRHFFNFALTVSALTLFIVGPGCCTTMKDAQIVEFQRKHPNEARAYSYIYPVATEMYDMIFKVKSGTISGVGHSLKTRFGNDPDIAKYADLILRQEAKTNRDWEALLHNLREASAHGGVICEYEFADDKRKEIGLLVLKSGNIVKREPWIVDRSPQSVEGNQP